MPRIKQYFAPTRRINPSNLGYEAREGLARSQEALAGSGERTAEAWTQAARRLGTLGTETAEMDKQVGELHRQDVLALRAQIPRAEPAREGGGARIRVGNPNQLQDQLDRADKINAAREVAQSAAVLFQQSYPVDPTTGAPFTAASWALNQRTRQFTDQTQATAEKGAEKYPIDPTTGSPFTPASWASSQRQQEFSQEQYRDQQEIGTQARQQAAGQPSLTGPNGQPWTTSQYDLWKRQTEISDFNRQNPNLPSGQLPVDPTTGKNFTPNEWDRYKNENTFQYDQKQNSDTPLERTAPPAPPADNGPGLVSNTVSDAISAGSQLWDGIKNAIMGPSSDNTTPDNATPADQTGLAIPIPPATGSQ